MEQMSEVKKGTVKFFNGSYGFIAPSDEGKDIYFHKSCINIGVKTLSEIKKLNMRLEKLIEDLLQTMLPPNNLSAFVLCLID